MVMLLWIVLNEGIFLQLFLQGDITTAVVRVCDGRHSHCASTVTRVV